MTWPTLQAKLKIYIAAFVVAAVPIVVWAAWDLIRTPHDSAWTSGWIVLTVLAILTVPFFLFLPSVNATIGIGDAYIMAIAMMYGVAPCVVATLCHTVIASIVGPRRTKVYAHRVVYNASSLVCGAWLYSSIYQWLNPSHSIALQEIVLPAALLMTTLFLFNSITTSVAIGWAQHERVMDFWAKNCLPLAIDFTVSSVSATFIVSLSYFEWYVPLGAAPLVGVVWGWNKLNKARAMEAEKHLTEQKQLYFRTVESLALAVDAKDQTTYGHIQRVRAYAMRLAKICRITDPDELMAIEYSSVLHDIGKLKVADYILNKPGPLTVQEFEKMKVHAVAGHEILEKVDFPFPVAEYVRHHHERWDGSGYPDGLKGEKIPMGARILALADAFDAIRASRPYKVSSGIQESLEILRGRAGTFFDPNLVALFADHIVELEEAAEGAASNPREEPEPGAAERTECLLTSANLTAPVVTHSDAASVELVRLAEFCTSLGGQVDLRDALSILARRLEAFLPLSTCIFYLDQGDQSLRAEHVLGQYAETLVKSTMSLGKGISGWVAAYRRPMINARPALEFQNIEGDFSALADSLAVPLLTGDQCIGSLVLFSKDGSTYRQSHLELLQTATLHIAPFIAQLLQRRSLAEDADILDPVTGMRWAAYLSVIGPQLIATAEQNRLPLCLLSLQVSNLRQIINLYGWHLGDEVMRKAAEVMKTELRETDVVVRYGHQGFVALLPNARLEHALRCMQRIQHQIRTTTVGTLPGGYNICPNCEAAAAAYPENGVVIPDLLSYSQKTIFEESKPASASKGDAAGTVLEFPPRG